MTEATLVPGDNDLTIHQVKASSFIGLFRVPISQMVQHPKQRLINTKWVGKLKEKFQEGVDRASHPIGVVLVQAKVPDELLGTPNQNPAGQQSLPQEPRELPADVQVHVFDGQHRIEAWSSLAGPADQYWFANVYRKCKPSIVP